MEGEGKEWDLHEFFPVLLRKLEHQAAGGMGR